jgi:hypothetical protein
MASVDAIDSALWLPVTDIIACDDKLINVDDNEMSPLEGSGSWVHSDGSRTRE